MRLGRLSVLLGAVLVSLFPSSASGAVVFGSNLSQPPNTTLCFKAGVSPLSCTTAITGLPVANRAPGGVLAPASGVITSWTVRSGPSSIDHEVRLRVVRNDTGKGTGPIEILPKAGGFRTYAARVPVAANDMLGIDTLNVPEGLGAPIIRTTSGANVDHWLNVLADGETRVPDSNEATNIELLINATIEPDADGDGFGDETQDGCPTVGNGGAACPPLAVPNPPTPPSGSSQRAPETILGKRPAGTIHARKVTFRFNSNTAGSSFQCKLDKKPFRSCKSPKTYKGLSEGRHTFKVRAVGPTGLIDPTPGKRTFKVEL